MHPEVTGITRVPRGLSCARRACYHHGSRRKIRLMDQASRIVAGWTGLISHERSACAAWNKAVGKKIALRTRALKMVRNTLVVEVLGNLEKAIGSDIVTDLELRVMPPRRGPQRATREPLVLEPLDEADKIQDPSLRRIYKAARQREIA